MKILYAAGECAPFVKTGGLGDVAHALPISLAKEEDTDEVCVFLPYYKSIKENPEFKMEFVTNFYVPLAWRRIYCGIFKFVDKAKKLTYYFIDNDDYFYRDKAYGYFDDGERFAFFSKAILEALLHIDFYPDVVHMNDWQTALIPAMLKAQYDVIPEFKRIKTVFTIHNIEYQGKASNEFLNDILGFSESWRYTMTHMNCINFMKSAIVLSDKVTTVSKTY
ncbi:MAG: glycogen/starch synthase, partial [Oscillospiraceae bacterium]